MVGSNGKFNPKNNITRQEIAVLLNNVYDIKQTEGGIENLDLAHDWLVTSKCITGSG